MNEPTKVVGLIMTGLLCFGFALMGEFETIGLLGNQSLIGENGIYLMLFGLLGFVGVHIYCPSIFSFWTGFSVMALGHASNSDK